MKKLVTTVLVVVMMATLFSGISFAEESYDIIYLTPSTASSFWSQVEVGILQAKADLEAAKAAGDDALAKAKEDAAAAAKAAEDETAVLQAQIDELTKKLADAQKTNP